MKKSLILAHRGASAYAPENTIIAFKEAIKMGADGFELDVHLSKDGYLIVIHDESVDRTTNGNGFIKDLTLDEIKRLDAGSWYDSKFYKEKVSTLDEVVHLVKDTPLLVNIEIKNGPFFYEGIEQKIVDCVVKYDMQDRVIISSFDHYSVVKIKEINPSIKTGALFVSRTIAPWKYIKKIGADALHPHFISVTSEMVKNCHESNIEIHTYTVNEPEHINYLNKLGVDSIITNFPDRAKEIVDNLKK
ncbi:MAG: glycerophosphodiester phosphodiesterase [Alkaliphilus sp.]